MIIQSVAQIRPSAGILGGGPAPVQSAPVATEGVSSPSAEAIGGPSPFLTFLSQGFSALAAVFTKVVDWVKGLIAPNPPTEILSPEEAELAKRYRLLPTKGNIGLFRAEVTEYDRSGTLGPGVNKPDAVKQLQLALSRLGFTASPTGSYDQATETAVTRFKYAAGLHQTYRSADGNWAVNEYATPDVVQALLERLRVA